jgi:hypothetical protein
MKADQRCGPVVHRTDANHWKWEGDLWGGKGWLGAFLASKLALFPLSFP